MFPHSTVRRGHKPTRSAVLDLHEIGGTFLLLLIHPAYWPRAARLLRRAVLLLGRWCWIQCRITWYYWWVGVPQAEIRRRIASRSLHRG
jgi:hypothetical protein